MGLLRGFKTFAQHLGLAGDEAVVLDGLVGHGGGMLAPPARGLKGPAGAGMGLNAAILWYGCQWLATGRLGPEKE